MISWSEAFARQANSDLDAYFLLSRSNLPVSHQLHYLQMWLEKLCKAYVWDAEARYIELRRKHQVIAAVLPGLISEHWRRIGFTKVPELKVIRDLCREIDLLHPQVDDDGRRPDNVEYPWAGASGDIEIPALWKFRLAQKLKTGPGLLLMKAAGGLTRHAFLITGAKPSD